LFLNFFKAKETAKNELQKQGKMGKNQAYG
jgi:hypothetical protein